MQRGCMNTGYAARKAEREAPSSRDREALTVSVPTPAEGGGAACRYWQPPVSTRKARTETAVCCLRNGDHSAFINAFMPSNPAAESAVAARVCRSQQILHWPGQER